MSRELETSSTDTREVVHDIILSWLRDEAALDVESVGHDELLFELGIDSMGAASISSQLERLTRKVMDPEVVYELQTIEELAEYLDSLPQASAPQPAVTLAAEAATAVETLDGNILDGNILDGSISEGGAVDANDERRDLIAHYERLNRRVRGLKADGLYFFEPEISVHDGAWVVADGKRMLMLGSYEYLGLLEHPHLRKTAISAIEEFGTGHHGVRLLAGTTTLHRKLEAKLAAFMEADDAVVFSSGFVTNLATVSTLVGRGDCVIGDQWNHASIVDGCCASGAEFLEFRHNDMDSLAEMLERAGARRTMVVVDSVFSMDGDIINLPAVIELCQRFGALLMVDEAHSLGVLGKTGRGIQEHFDLDPGDIDIKMGTLSKTFAGCGGFVAARDEVTTFLRHHARGYIFSGALPAGQVSVAIAALEVLEREPELVDRLWENVWHYLNGLKKLGFDTASSVTPIVPVMTRTDDVTLEMTRICRAEGLLAVPVTHPAVPMDAPRLRTCVSAIHSSEDIDFALDVLARAGRQTGLIE